MQLKTFDFQPADGGITRPDVVLIHGIGGDASLWQTQIDLLVKCGFRCVALELRGHGGTPEPGGSADLQVHVDDVLHTLEESGIRFPAIFVGHSLGAIISTSLAQQRPELFIQVLAVCLPGKVIPLVANLFEIFLRSPYHKLRGTWLSKTLPRRLQSLLHTERHSMQQILNTFRGINLLQHQLEPTCPIHLCAGRFDVVAPFHYVEQLHLELPNSTFKLFDRAGHSCMDDQPSEFNDWLLEKLQVRV